MSTFSAFMIMIFINIIPLMNTNSVYSYGRFQVKYIRKVIIIPCSPCIPHDPEPPLVVRSHLARRGCTGIADVSAAQFRHTASHKGEQFRVYWWQVKNGLLCLDFRGVCRRIANPAKDNTGPPLRRQAGMEKRLVAKQTADVPSAQAGDESGPQQCLPHRWRPPSGKVVITL